MKNIKQFFIIHFSFDTILFLNLKPNIVNENILKDKSYKFSIRIVRLTQYLQLEKKEFVMSKQVLRSGTAIGALIREGEFVSDEFEKSCQEEILK